jgi:hypothetical protein
MITKLTKRQTRIGTKHTKKIVFVAFVPFVINNTCD